jgi:hypothetical protein
MRFVRQALCLITFAALVLSAPLICAQMTLITATSVYSGNTPITGTICFTAVDQFHNAIPVTKQGGGFYVKGQPFCQTLTAGALAGSLSVPNAATDSAPGHGYAMVIYNSSTSQASDTLYISGIAGSSWSLDTYVPATSTATTNAFTFTQGSGTVSGVCTAPALYSQSGTPYVIYTCGLDGQWHLASDTTGLLGSPTGSQVVTQPANTFFSLNFSGPGYLAINGAPVHLNGGELSIVNDPTNTVQGLYSGMNKYQQTNRVSDYNTITIGRYAGITNTAHGEYYGNNGTSSTTSNDWTSLNLDNLNMTDYARDIDVVLGVQYHKYGLGDFESVGSYGYTYGGEVGASDEGEFQFYGQLHQLPYTAGTVTSGATTGSNLITTTVTHGAVYNDGAPLIDITQGGTVTATIVGLVAVSGLNVDAYTLAGATLTPSTAWGNIIVSQCTNNNTGEFQNYVATTCNVTLGTSPASPGAFTLGSHIFLAGQTREEAAVTAVGTVSGGVQSITFLTRYAWDNAGGNTNAAVVMQGGPGGQSFLVSGTESTWPMAFFVVGALSSTELVFADCAEASCNNPIGTSPNHPVVGQSITFYPSAEITGTNGGTSNAAELATNTIPFAVGDVVISTPATMFLQNGAQYVMEQSTPCPANAVTIGCAGVRVLNISGGTDKPIGAGFLFFSAGDSSTNYSYAGTATYGAIYGDLQTNYRPIDSILSIGNQYVTGASGPYGIFAEHGSGSRFTFNPADGSFGFTGQIQAPSARFSACCGSEEVDVLAGNGTSIVRTASPSAASFEADYNTALGSTLFPEAVFKGSADGNGITSSIEIGLCPPSGSPCGTEPVFYAVNNSNGGASALGLALLDGATDAPANTIYLGSSAVTTYAGGTATGDRVCTVSNGFCVQLGTLITTSAAPTVAAGQIGFGGTTAVATNCGSLTGETACLVINVAGTNRYIPFY